MALRAKIRVIAGLVVCGAAAALHLVFNQAMLGSFARLEDEQARLDLDRVTNTLSQQTTPLGASGNRLS